MDPISPSSPLISLDCLALDTETTGLDTKSVRLVQIAAMRLRGAVETDSAPFDSLVDPCVPIPQASIAVHGITDEAVAGAPDFQTVWDRFNQFAGGAVLIAYNTGFDIAVLKRECGLAGLSWPDRHWLCVRVLARLAALPGLEDDSLDALARWFGVTISGRHTALGDAKAAAAIWAGLLPLLKARGIRTLGEALAAGAKLNEAGREGISLLANERETDMSLLASEHPAPRVDSYPYRHTLAEVMSAPPVFAPADTPLREAARLLLEKRISSVLIDMDGQPGIVTERDLLRGFSTETDSAKPISLRDLASRPLHALAADSYLYRAIGRVNRLAIRHLAVSGPDGEIVGMVTPRSLLRERATDAIMLGDEIDSARDGAALAAARARLTALARGLIDDGMDGHGVCRVISAELCGMTRRAAELAEQWMAAEGRGAPPVPYAVMVLGSGGRGESLLAPDQDNAIVFESGEAGGPEDRWFASLGGHIADLLDEAGVPYCKGGIMARNAQWRKSEADWRQTIDLWVRQSRPEDLLNVDIFFDGVAVHGKLALAERIWRYAYEHGHRSTVFQKLMTELARNWRSPLGLLGGFRSDKGDRTDLKLGALMPIFTGARVLSIRHHIPAVSTSERLRGAARSGAFSLETAEDIVAAHQVVLQTLLAQQFRDASAGIPLSNYVETGKLSAPEKRRLREAVKTIEAVMDAVSEARM